MQHYVMSVYKCAGQQSVGDCVCIESREIQATTGSLCNLEPVGEHVATSSTAAIKM